MNDPKVLFSQLNRLVQSIQDESIKSFTLSMIEKASPMAWTRPASLRHHLQDEREEYGNLLHSVRVASICRLLSEAFTITCEYSKNKGIDILLSAAILHDTCRHGLFGMSEKSRKDHPNLVRVFADQWELTCEYFDDIMSVIENHMGRWSELPLVLELDSRAALYIADLIVARWAEIMPNATEEKQDE